MPSPFSEANNKAFRNTGIILALAGALLLIGICLLLTAFAYTFGGAHAMALPYLLAGIVSTVLGTIAVLIGERRVKRQ